MHLFFSTLALGGVFLLQECCCKALDGQCSSPGLCGDQELAESGDWPIRQESPFVNIRPLPYPSRWGRELQPKNRTWSQFLNLMRECSGETSREHCASLRQSILDVVRRHKVLLLKLGEDMPRADEYVQIAELFGLIREMPENQSPNCPDKRLVCISNDANHGKRMMSECYHGDGLERAPPVWLSVLHCRSNEVSLASGTHLLRTDWLYERVVFHTADLLWKMRLCGIAHMELKAGSQNMSHCTDKGSDPRCSIPAEAQWMLEPLAKLQQSERQQCHQSATLLLRPLRTVMSAPDVDQSESGFKRPWAFKHWLDEGTDTADARYIIFSLRRMLKGGKGDEVLYIDDTRALSDVEQKFFMDEIVLKAIADVENRGGQMELHWEKGDIAIFDQLALWHKRGISLEGASATDAVTVRRSCLEGRPLQVASEESGGLRLLWRASIMSPRALDHI